jgi:ribokinase
MSLLVVGALHLDVIVRAPHLPEPDETVQGSSVDYVVGGKGGNQALAAARMGAPTAFAGRAGTDTFGEILRLKLYQSDVDCSLLQQDAGDSGMSVAIVDDRGEYGAVIVSGANLAIDAEAIRLPDGLRVLSLQNELPEAVNIAVARRAKAQGAQVWLNAAPARPLSPALLSCIDLMIVNRVEAAFYSDTPDLPPLLETMGAQGVRWAGREWPAFAIEAHSAHGAGDMFIGALAAEVCRGVEIAEALAFAQAAAALHVAQGTSTRKPLDRVRVEAFLAAQPNR